MILSCELLLNYSVVTVVFSLKLIDLVIKFSVEIMDYQLQEECEMANRACRVSFVQIKSNAVQVFPILSD